MEIKDQIRQAVEEKILGTDTFLVDIKTSFSKIAVFVDNPRGMKLEECVEISRHLEAKPELVSVFETHELEVSSPGMDEPLKVLKQYEKRIGQEVSVLMKDGVRKNGTLKSAGENEIVLVETKHVKENGKRVLHTVEHRIPMDSVKDTTVVFNINKILH
jgi:ribosome maturation factor RimP